MAERLGLLMKYAAHAPLVERQPAAERSALDPLRPLLRLLERIFKEGAFVLVLLGVAIGLRDMRSWLLVMAIPLYFLLAQSAMHAEFRYALTAHYLLFILYAVA